MPIDLKSYSPEWRAIRVQRLAQAGYQCEGCGIRDRSIRESSHGSPYMVYLSIAHLVVLLAVVGNGHYLKEADRSLTVVAEYGSCVGLSTLL